MIRITVLAGKTFRGVHHFGEMNYDCSDELALYAVREGIARFTDPQPIGGLFLSDPDAFKGPKG
jgi:hypothetical protein